MRRRAEAAAGNEARADGDLPEVRGGPPLPPQPPFLRHGRHNQCAERQAEWVQEKARAKFRSYFEPRTGIDLARKAGAPAEEARKKFDSLFN